MPTSNAKIALSEYFEEILSRKRRRGKSLSNYELNRLDLLDAERFYKPGSYKDYVDKETNDYLHQLLRLQQAGKWTEAKEFRIAWGNKKRPPD